MNREHQYKQNTLEQMRLCEGENSQGECEYKIGSLTKRNCHCIDLKAEGNCPIVVGN